MIKPLTQWYYSSLHKSEKLFAYYYTFPLLQPESHKKLLTIFTTTIVNEQMNPESDLLSYLTVTSSIHFVRMRMLIVLNHGPSKLYGEKICIHLFVVVSSHIDCEISCIIVWKFDQSLHAWCPQPIWLSMWQVTWYAFTHLLQKIKIKNVTTICRKQQFSAIFKLTHQKMSPKLKIFLLPWPPQIAQGVILCGWQSCNYNVFYVIDYFHCPQGKSKWPDIFKGMLLNDLPVLKWQSTIHNKETLVNNTLLKANHQQINCNYNLKMSS